MSNWCDLARVDAFPLSQRTTRAKEECGRTVHSGSVTLGTRKNTGALGKCSAGEASCMAGQCSVCDWGSVTLPIRTEKGRRKQREASQEETYNAHTRKKEKEERRGGGGGGGRPSKRPQVLILRSMVIPVADAMTRPLQGDGPPREAAESSLESSIAGEPMSTEWGVASDIKPLPEPAKVRRQCVNSKQTARNRNRMKFGFPNAAISERRRICADFQRRNHRVIE